MENPSHDDDSPRGNWVSGHGLHYPYIVSRGSSRVLQGIRSLKSVGIGETLRLTSIYVGQRYLRTQPNFVEHRYLLGQRISEAVNSTVAYGAFAGLVLPRTSRWSGADQGSMLLGMYEREVLEALCEMSATCHYLIDVGAADGYYAVGGLTSGLFDRVVCFESDKGGQRIIAENAEMNGVRDRLTILGEAKGRFVQEACASAQIELSSTVLLVDIEGGEYDLLSEEVLVNLRQSRLIVELHRVDGVNADSEIALRRRLASNFKVTYVTQGARNPNQFPLLAGWSDDDRWLMCSESRGKLMEWALCEPLDI